MSLTGETVPKRKRSNFGYSGRRDFFLIGLFSSGASVGQEIGYFLTIRGELFDRAPKCGEHCGDLIDIVRIPLFWSTSTFRTISIDTNILRFAFLNPAKIKM